MYVFPEVLQGDLIRFAESSWPGRKVLFCQNHFHLFGHPIDAHWLRQNGFEHFIAPSHVAAAALKTVLGLPTVQVVPVAIDHTLFYPRVKRKCIAVSPRKWPGSKGVTALAHLLQRMFRLKYPQFADIPWIRLENMSQKDVAEALGQAVIYLSLAHQEAIGLLNLEAMASGCAVIGLQGVGGKEYATSQNGLWFSPEQIEEMVDSIGSVLSKIDTHSLDVDKMIHAAQKTASGFNIDRTRTDISRIYADIMSRDGSFAR